jgi:hypothetical protein
MTDTSDRATDGLVATTLLRWRKAPSTVVINRDGFEVNKMLEQWFQNPDGSDGEWRELPIVAHNASRDKL